MIKKMSRNIFYNGINNLLKSGIPQEFTPFQIQEIIKCKNDIKYFLETYVTIVNQEKGKIPFRLYDYQNEFIECVKNTNRFIGLQPRQSGKSITTAGFILHYITFNADKYVAILANKGKSARNLLTKIKNMYKSLPLWLQQGATEWNKGDILLDNGSSITAGATSSDSIRGDSVSLLLIDETAFIDKGKWDDFWASSYPTISSSESAKIVLLSTPFGMNHYYKLWTDAINNKNGFTYFEVPWQRIPNRDEKWKNKTIAEIGEQRFAQEFGNEFIGSAGTLISGKTLKNIPFVDPAETRFDDKFKIYSYPEEDHKYISISDFAEGTEGDFTTIHIFDVTDLPWKQIAVYRDNALLPRETPDIITKISTFYNNALIVGESNSIGIGILDDINFENEYENIFYGDILESKKNEKRLAEYFGIKMTKRSKRIGNTYLKEYIESDSMIIHDFDTVSELSSYIKKSNGTYSAEDGKHDDLVTPLVLLSYFMQNKEFVEGWLETNTYAKRKSTSDAIEESLLPIGFYCDGTGFHSMEDDDESDDYISPDSSKDDDLEFFI